MPVTARPSDADLARLRATLDAELPAFLADLERLVNIDCGSFTAEGVDEVGRWTGAFMERLGATVEHRPDPKGKLGQTVVGTFDGVAGRPRVLLIGTWTRCSTTGPRRSAPSASTETSPRARVSPT